MLSVVNDHQDVLVEGGSIVIVGPQCCFLLLPTILKLLLNPLQSQNETESLICPDNESNVQDINSILLHVPIRKF